ncbi:MAG: hypothetical protein CMQ03_00385 [Gammaproteobacteria bacterium]|mgnify:CR=1 FL=1|nr:hypothetical protein [Gammaproteobacteria bacterium]|tara:strand:+ start:197 stop:466 length:270 start_codon:yes stop_codon:yes gene_type:complete
MIMKERKLDSIYTDNYATMKVVEIGRNMITACELNKLFPKDDLMWNRAVTAGNKLTTIGTTWGIKSVKELSKDESKAVQEFLKNKDKYI